MLFVPGHFVRLKDDPTALFLFNDDARIFHSIDKVSFLHRINNTIEGEKLYPRPFITEQTADEKMISGYKFGSKIISTGDKVIISYVNGSIYNPLVIGSVEPFGSFYQNNFLLTMPEEWEQEKKRLENDDYILEYKDDSHGEITLDITAKEKDATKNNQGGTGNITINLIGTDKNGNINLNLNGKAILTAVGNVNVDGENVIINGGTRGGARLNDEVKSTSVEDSTFWDTFKNALDNHTHVAGSLIAPSGGGAVTGISGAPTSLSTPSSLTGKITHASGTVKIGD